MIYRKHKFRFKEEKAMSEDTTYQSQYYLLIDILAEMVINYFTISDSGNIKKLEKKEGKKGEY